MLWLFLCIGFFFAAELADKLRVWLATTFGIGTIGKDMTQAVLATVTSLFAICMFTSVLIFIYRVGILYLIPFIKWFFGWFNFWW